MVRKLIRYDFQSYFRLLFPVQLIILGIALLNRIIQFFEPPTGAPDIAASAYQAGFVATLVLYIVSIIVCFVMTVIVGIIRFYQGMYTNEGYLMHTLPVTPTQHIFAKLLTSVIFFLGSALAAFLSFMIITAGQVNIEVFKAFFYFMNRYIQSSGFDGVLYIFEILILLCVSLFHIFIKFYFCLSVGQLAKRKKVLLAFGVFFGIYAAKQIIGTVLIVTMTLSRNLISLISNWLSAYGALAMHIMIWISIVIYSAAALVYFFITRYIMSKKLNLT